MIQRMSVSKTFFVTTSVLPLVTTLLFFAEVVAVVVVPEVAPVAAEARFLSDPCTVELSGTPRTLQSPLLAFSTMLLSLPVFFSSWRNAFGICPLLNSCSRVYCS